MYVLQTSLILPALQHDTALKKPKQNTHPVPFLCTRVKEQGSSPGIHANKDFFKSS